jgi:succinate dehydrogenase hydrophobic anchor subunit
MTAVVLLFLLIWIVSVTIAQQLASVEHVPAARSDAIGSVK